MKLKLNVNKILAAASTAPSKWYLDNVVYHDRATDPTVLIEFLKRIKTLQDLGTSAVKEEKEELTILVELANEMNEKECVELLSNSDENVRQRYIESVARKAAIEVLCNNIVKIETMEELCKLSPEDFILASKRSQDLINAIKELILQGETLSQDVAGA